MTDGNAQPHWSDEQWTRVRQVIYEEARSARVAGSVLPLFGPLEPDARYVTREVLNSPHAAAHADVPGFTVSDTETLKLSTLQAKVYLRGAQLADPDLTSALIAFRRAANVIARLEDEIVLLGQGYGNAPFNWPPGHEGETPLWEVVGGQSGEGLLNCAEPLECTEQNGLADFQGERGDFLVAAVSRAVGELEARYHVGPYACILDQDYFNIAQTPTSHSRVLPQERIVPFLNGGALLRSSVLDHGLAKIGREDEVPAGHKGTGIVIALGGAPIDLVVATDITVQFLQLTLETWNVFRVTEKIALRVNQPDAVIGLPAAPKKP